MNWVKMAPTWWLKRRMLNKPSMDVRREVLHRAVQQAQTWEYRNHKRGTTMPNQTPND